MMGLCVAAAGIAVFLPLQEFTLAWTHSIEKIRWEEDYRIADSQLLLTQARIRGSGAGMEPPPGARLINGVWHYQPPPLRLERLHLARSNHAPDYQLCAAGSCRQLAEILAPAANDVGAELFPCLAPKAAKP